MKKELLITFKDPDAAYEAINEYVEDDIKASNLDEEERDAIREIRQEKYGEVTSKFLEYGEYITIAFNLETSEARVVSKKELEEMRNG